MNVFCRKCWHLNSFSHLIHVSGNDTAIVRFKKGKENEWLFFLTFHLHFLFIGKSSWRKLDGGGVFKALKHRRASKKLSNNLGVRYNDGMYRRSTEEIGQELTYPPPPFSFSLQWLTVRITLYWWMFSSTAVTNRCLSQDSRGLMFVIRSQKICFIYIIIRLCLLHSAKSASSVF